MIQTDPNFPAHADFGDLESLRGVEVMERQNEVAELLKVYDNEEILDAEGRKFDVLARRTGSGDVAEGDACTGFIVSVAADTGEISMTTSTISYSGAIADSFTVPTYPTGAIAPETGTFLVWVGITYGAVNNSTFGTTWELKNVVFEAGATRSTDNQPTFNFSTSTWSGDGTHYSPWATIVDRVVTDSFGGGIICKICSPAEVIVQHGCTI